jgi:hypothetical protein
MLKRLSLVGALFILCTNSFGQKTVSTTGTILTGPKFTLTTNDTLFDFGMIEEEDYAKHQFLFQNTGDAPLIIDNISCTIPHVKFKWPSRMIKPGKTGVILVTYTSFMDEGTVAGDIMISSNATKEAITPLHIKGKIMTCEESMQEPLCKSAKK